MAKGSGGKVSHVQDPPALIQKCLTCTKPKCNNCVKDFPREELRNNGKEIK